MSNFKYIINNTEYQNSLLKSVIQSTSDTFARDEDVTELIEDIEIFFQIESTDRENDIINYVLKEYGDDSLLLGNKENMYNLYVIRDKEKKQVLPVFSSKIKAELKKNSNFYTFGDYKYFHYYLLRRADFRSISKISLRDVVNFILESAEGGKNLILDIINLNIIIVDKKINYVQTLRKPGNTKYMILLQNNDRYKNITIVVDDKKLNLLDEKENKDIIDYIENNIYIEEDTDYKYEETTKLDYILEEIENSNYTKEDIFSNVNLLD